MCPFVDTRTFIIEIRDNTPMPLRHNLDLEISKNSNPYHTPDLRGQSAKKRALGLRVYSAEGLGAGANRPAVGVGVGTGSRRDGR
jgi:hypothetical protein